MDILELINNLNFSSIMWKILTPLLFSLGDIITGYIQALINRNVDSQKMRTGLLHKILIILVIILSFVLQLAFGIEYISGVVCIYVVIMELVSILENLKKAGLDIGKLGNVLKAKSDSNLNDNLGKLVEKINEKDDIIIPITDDEEVFNEGEKDNDI